MTMENGLMPSIIVCAECGYNRSSEDDGQQFHEVCGICYEENCKTPIGNLVICGQCFVDAHKIFITEPGETLLT